MSSDTYPEESAQASVVPMVVTEAAAVIAARPPMRIVNRISAVMESGEAAIHRWLIRHSIAALRTSLGSVLLGFGFLKYFPGLSPAQSLVLVTMHLLTLGLVPTVVPGTAAMVSVATFECAIGLLLITGRPQRRQPAGIP